MPLRSQAARADEAAFAALYERHHQALYRYCRSILRNDEDARDALQSTMANAFAALRSEERDFELRPWLFRIAHNESVSRLRQRRESVGLESMEALGTDSLAQTLEDRERLAQLSADLLDLPDRQRTALVLRELSGLGHAEIAAVLECSTAVAKQTIFEARLALHQCAGGRAMPCAEVQRALSDGDGRVVRSRRIRAHVRSCRSCSEFKAALARRPADLAALAPGLPAAAGAGLLAHLLPAKTGLASGAATSAGSGLVAGTVGGKLAVVAAATATIAGVATVAHVERSPSPDRVVRSPPPAVVVRSRPAALTIKPRVAAAPATPQGTPHVAPARQASGATTTTATHRAVAKRKPKQGAGSANGHGARHASSTPGRGRAAPAAGRRASRGARSASRAPKAASRRGLPHPRRPAPKLEHGGASPIAPGAAGASPAPAASTRAHGPDMATGKPTAAPANAAHGRP